MNHSADRITYVRLCYRGSTFLLAYRCMCRSLCDVHGTAKGNSGTARDSMRGYACFFEIEMKSRSLSSGHGSVSPELIEAGVADEVRFLRLR